MGNTLRIMSANLWNGNADAEGFANMVLALAADVVAVQELSPEQAEALSAVMPYGALEPSNVHRGMGIAMKRPAETFRRKMTDRDVHSVLLDPSDWPQVPSPLEIMNTHIMAPHVLWARPHQIRPGPMPRAGRSHQL